ncbi:MAG: hypothetical protein R3F17_16620 [Planctomycetota bacterium]
MDLRDFPATLEYVLRRASFRRDLFLLPNLSMDSLDYAGPEIDLGSKGILLGISDRSAICRATSRAPQAKASAA